MKKMESEKDLEARLVAEVRKRGGMCIKQTSQFHRGLPDRLVLLPYHTQAFVELKSTGRLPTALQMKCMKQLRDLSFFVYIVDSTESLDVLLEKLDTRLARCRAREEAKTR